MYLMKITKSEYIDELVKKGKMFLTLASSFRDTSLYGYDKVDPHEGLLSRGYQLGVFLNSERQYLFDNQKHTIVVNGTECIYSLKLVNEPLENSIIRNPNNGEKEFIVGVPFLYGLLGEEDLCEYSMLIIKNVFGFLNCVKTAITKSGLNGVMGEIEYDDHNFESSFSPFSDEYAMEAYYHKDRKFLSQSEYRILVQNSEKTNLVLNIGKEFFVPPNYFVIKFTPENIRVFRKAMLSNGNV